MSEFLNPKSMVTPGIAGGTVMFLVNGISKPFPELPQKWIALALSFLVGLGIIIQVAQMRILERLVYWAVNSLVIFAVGFGSTYLGRDVTVKSSPTASRLSALGRLVPKAYAEGKKTAKNPAKGAEASGERAELKSEVEALKARNDELQEALNRSEEKKREEKQVKAQEDKDAFFKAW